MLIPRTLAFQESEKDLSEQKLYKEAETAVEDARKVLTVQDA